MRDAAKKAGMEIWMLPGDVGENRIAEIIDSAIDEAQEDAVRLAEAVLALAPPTLVKSQKCPCWDEWEEIIALAKKATETGGQHG